MATSQISWDWGTAYDLFISLEVLHKPTDFGVRGAWAAGVRARLDSDEREVLEQSRELFSPPFHWIYNLPAPKDVAAALWTLGQTPPKERLPALALAPWIKDDVRQVLEGIAARESWGKEDQEALQAALEQMYKGEREHMPSAEKQEMILHWWSRAEEFGEDYLEALRAYQEVFFAEEEERIRPALQKALSQAQELAGRLALPELLEELSQGLRFEDLPQDDNVILAPSYWCTPLMFMVATSDDRRIYIFGARPPDASLVPGEQVPDALLRSLKALSDPTRLRIMHYLAQEPQSPAQLARRLRLRAPTVTHHLKILRQAGLVQLTLGKGKEITQYAARDEALAAACDLLKGFVQEGDESVGR